MAFKVVLALAIIVCLAGLWVAHCARNATVDGVPAAGVPSHSPAFVTRLVRNFTFPLGLAVIHASIINPNFYGVPDVEIKASQLSKDSDHVAKFEYDLYWPKFLVDGQYTSEIKGVIHSHHEGNWSLLFEHVHWIGQLHFNKEKPHIDKLSIRWTNKNLEVHVTGGGIQGDAVAGLIKTGLDTAFATGTASLAVEAVLVASDLDTGLWVAHCARNATVDGVPAAGVPSHSPAFVTRLVKNFTFPLGLAVIHASIINPNFYGVPDVEIKASQLSKDSDPVAKFEYDLYWPKFLVDGQFTSEIKGVIHKHHEGNWSLLFEHVHWTGQLHFNKEQPHIDKLKINWTNKNIEVHVVGAGIEGETVAVMLQSALETAFGYEVVNPAVEAVLSHRLNDVWIANATRVEALLDWCRQDH
nr:unnamed protein product [Callosobruchus analis]